MWEPQFEEARNWVNQIQDLESLDPNNYRNSYLALLKLFREYVAPLEYNQVLAGALAIYGWMPTILKKAPSAAQWARHRDALDELRTAENWHSALVILGRDIDVLKFANNSLVGTSKFLHFLNPCVFPIWDSRIAGCIKLYHKYQQENIDNYVSYAGAVADTLRRDFTLSEPFLNFIGEVSPVRKLEMLLFLYGGALNNHANGEL